MLGRETAIQKLTWDADGWPRTLDGSGDPTLDTPGAGLTDHAWPAAPVREHFDAAALPIDLLQRGCWLWNCSYCKNGAWVGFVRFGSGFGRGSLPQGQHYLAAIFDFYGAFGTAVPDQGAFDLHLRRPQSPDPSRAWPYELRAQHLQP